jgi:hypothetical protein
MGNENIEITGLGKGRRYWHERNKGVFEMDTKYIISRLILTEVFH